MTTNDLGYYRCPTLAGDRIVLVTEDDLFAVPLAGGVAIRLTTTPGPVFDPRLSPSGEWLAYSAADEGSYQVYVMPAEGGESRRLTYHAEACRVVGWTSDERSVVFRSAMLSGQQREPELFTVARTGGAPVRLPYGPATTLAYSPDGSGVALHRNGADPASWKRYRGGLAGEIWVGRRDGGFRRITEPGTFECLPMWALNGRIYFLSDRGGTGNIWSVQPDGTDRREETHHRDAYARWPSLGAGPAREPLVVYQHAADIRVLDVRAGEDRAVTIRLRSDGTTVRRYFFDPPRFLDSFSLSPDGRHLAADIRGKPVTMPLFEGPVRPHGTRDVPDALAAGDAPPARAVRYRLTAWLSEDRLAAVSDASGEEEIHAISTTNGEERSLGRVGAGWIFEVAPSPDGARIAVADQAMGLHIIEVASGKAARVDESHQGRFSGLSWSADGRWLAYSARVGRHANIVCRNVESGETVRLTSPETHDFAPVFDPRGRYLYFLSDREIDPYPDNIQHDFGYPVTTGVFLAVLKKGEPSPFSSEFRRREEEEAARKERERKAKRAKREEEGEEEAASKAKGKEPKKAEDEEDEDEDEMGPGGKPKPVVIDADGIGGRVVRVPIDPARYVGLSATRTHLILVREPLEGLKDRPRHWERETRPRNALLHFDLKEEKTEVVLDAVTEVAHAPGAERMVVRVGDRLRVLKVGEKPSRESTDEPGRASGFLDLSRIRLACDPRPEWRQMFHEAWRLQRDSFWTEDMSGVDWPAARGRYLPLLPRVRTREELTDLLWDLQGELGTSHAYVVGGEYPPRPDYPVGLLGADIEVDPASGRYRIGRIVRGDSWDEDAASPLAAPGVEASAGDYILAVDGVPVAGERHPYEVLANKAGEEATLLLAREPDPKKGREVRVETLTSEAELRYREWIRRNEEYVAGKTGGRAGYIHLPDMSVPGLVAFHRSYLWQTRKDALIVDARNNGGGNVSPLLIAKLARKIIGYDRPRWEEAESYPGDAVVGPMVCLANERTGSDGDIFCQAFKVYRLGPLIGKRTWGGVIGISVHRTLIDGGITTQPEYAFWFEGVGWRIENRGVDPDIEVDNAPDDYIAGRDPQLDRGIAEVTRLLEGRVPLRPVLDPRAR